MQTPTQIYFRLAGILEWFKEHAKKKRIIIQNCMFIVFLNHSNVLVRCKCR